MGAHVAGVLARAFGSIEAIEQASAEDLEGIHEIGGQTAGSVHTFFSREENRRTLERLFEAGVNPQPPAGAPGTGGAGAPEGGAAGGGAAGAGAGGGVAWAPLAGKTFVVTGIL